MSTAYEKPYPTYIVPPPADIEDGVHTVASLEGRADQAAVVKAAQSTGTSCFDDGQPTPKANNASHA